MKYTNEVHLPDGNNIYVSDDLDGDKRIEQLYKQYGNLKVTVKDKTFGQSLQDGAIVLETTLEGLYE